MHQTMKARDLQRWDLVYLIPGSTKASVLITEARFTGQTMQINGGIDGLHLDGELDVDVWRDAAMAARMTRVTEEIEADRERALRRSA